MCNRNILDIVVERDLYESKIKQLYLIVTISVNLLVGSVYHSVLPVISKQMHQINKIFLFFCTFIGIIGNVSYKVGYNSV